MCREFIGCAAIEAQMGPVSVLLADEQLEFVAERILPERNKQRARRWPSR